MSFFRKSEKIDDNVAKKSVKKVDALVTGVILGGVIASLYGVKKIRDHADKKYLTKARMSSQKRRASGNVSFLAINNMYRGIIICILCLTPLSGVFAAISDEEVMDKVEACLLAKSTRSEASITDFYCPSGDYNKATREAYSEQRIAYEVIVAALFQDIDTDAEKSVKKMQDSREIKADVLTNTVSELIDGKTGEPQSGLSSRYQSVCKTNPGEGGIYSGRVRTILGKWAEKNQKNAPTMDGFPDSTCASLADAKRSVWENMAKIFAAKGQAKSLQNDKDRYMEKTKGAYDILLTKWQAYKRIIAQAVSKFTAYIRQAVK